MEPILTPSIINRLRSDGAEILEHLDLSNGLLVPEEMIQIAECIHDYYTAHHSVSPLQTIDLSGNLICGLDEYSDGEYDCSGLNKFVSELLLHGDKRILRKLTLNNNNIGTEGCVELGKLLSSAAPTFLKEISLSSCNINPSGLEKLVVGLDACKTVQFLDLRWNMFGKDGAVALGDALFKNKSLRRLDISHNNIGPNGAALFCEKICQNVSLQTLSMIECCLCDDGAKAVANMLKVNTGIINLDLQENCISDVGVEEIAKCIYKNKSLASLCLQFNSFTDNGIISLGKGLKNNANFKALYIYGNTKITSDGISEAVAQMQSNGNKQIALDIPC